jgi:hypothetical protein
VISSDEKTSIWARSRCHPSWLNQVQVFFSVVQRKVLSPNDFTELVEVEPRLTDVEKRYNTTARQEAAAVELPSPRAQPRRTPEGDHSSGPGRAKAAGQSELR